MMVAAGVLFVLGVLVGSLMSSSGAAAPVDYHHRQNGGVVRHEKLAAELVSPLEQLAGRAAQVMVGGAPALREADEQPVNRQQDSLRVKLAQENAQAAKAREEEAEKSQEAVKPGRGLLCPETDPNKFSDLQIPLKHLPRGKKTSVAEKYNRRAHNCVSNGIWNRVTIEDHHKILHNMVRLGRVQKNSFVLDWGSGCGHSLQFLNDEYDVTGVGIDVSELTIAYARTNTSKANLHCVADGTKLQWIPSNFFDHAISFGSVYHVYNRTLFCHVLRQLVRVVKAGGTVYNGWTENAEYKRDHVKMCFEDLDVSFQIFEERKEFANVAIFPLKAQQDAPNTYSLVITKTTPTLGDEPFFWENMPIVCGVHKCEKRSAAALQLGLQQQQQGIQQAHPETAKQREDADVAEGGDNAAATLPPPVVTALPSAPPAADDESDKEGWPSCPPYDAGIERLQIPLEHLPRKKKTSVAQKYDRRAHNCASHGVWHRVTIEDHEAILKKIGDLLDVKRDQVLFDWGSGCGHQLEFMHRMFGGRGLGVDVSNLTISYAISNTTRANRHCVADGSRLEWLPSNFFDHAYSFGSIYHVYNTTTFCHVLQEMVRVVKPGGKIYNGWTENKEFHRNQVVKCINTDTNSHHKIEVLEEVDLFHHVKNFPLKEHRQTPNSYSLLVTKS